MKSGIRKSLIWTVIVSETSHIFCCVLPTLFSLASLLSGMGLAVALPIPLVHFHDIMHRWELPMLSVSGVILVLGWMAIKYSDKTACTDSVCCAGDCPHTKSAAHVILKIATLLFIFNVLIYVGLHRSGWVERHAEQENHQHIEDVSNDSQN